MTGSFNTVTWEKKKQDDEADIRERGTAERYNFKNNPKDAIVFRLI